MSSPRDAAPPRLLHLGLGNFFRAHQCWYTDRAADGEAWPIAAFTGTLPGTTPLIRDLQAQHGIYTLVERGPERDAVSTIRSLHHAHPGADDEAWLGYWRSPELAAVTLTITEAGYQPGTTGALGRLMAGLQARHEAGAGPVALVPCDNLAGNGALLQRLVLGMAEEVNPRLLQWVSESVSVVSTMVDRITPRVTDTDLAQAAERGDRCPVVTEPYAEWVLSGGFPAGRPAWDATFTDDVTAYEDRKLWLLNGAHSLLAYSGSLLGHATVAAAVADGRCLTWLQEWWGDASRYLGQPDDELAAYRAALLERFGNARMHDRLDRIAVDGSQKLPVRIIPALTAARVNGRLPLGATRVLAAWIGYLRSGVTVADARAADIVTLTTGPLHDTVSKLLEFLSPGLGDDQDVVATVLNQCRELTA